MNAPTADVARLLVVRQVGVDGRELADELLVGHFGSVTVRAIIS